MIDTISLKYHSIKIPLRSYTRWSDSGKKRRRRFTLDWYGFTEYLPNSAPVTYTYFPSLKNGLLKVSFSVPHVIFGTNVKMITNLESAINDAMDMLPKFVEFPQLDLWSGILDRLDICYNFQTGDLVPWYVKALEPLEFPSRHTTPFTSAGVQFSNDRIILRFYDKARERKEKGDSVGALAAQGILRAEVELKEYYLKKYTDCKQPILRDVSEDLIFKILEMELSKLKILGRTIGTIKTTIKRLAEIYETWEALALTALVIANIDYPSVDLLAKDINLSPNSIGRHLTKKFHENGIPPTLTEYSEPLPPLYLDRNQGNV